MNQTNNEVATKNMEHHYFLCDTNNSKIEIIFGFNIDYPLDGID